jgi:hypothetical protein
MKYRADISTAIGYVIELIETSALAPLRSVVDHIVGEWRRRPRSPGLESGLKLESLGRFEPSKALCQFQPVHHRKEGRCHTAHTRIYRLQFLSRGHGSVRFVWWRSDDNARRQQFSAPLCFRACIPLGSFTFSICKTPRFGRIRKNILEQETRAGCQLRCAVTQPRRHIRARACGIIATAAGFSAASATATV